MFDARSAVRDLAGARWISHGGESAERLRSNAWFCFRKTFVCPERRDDSLLHITADYRYTVWVNGEWIGQGPIRGWPQAYFYDTYDVSPYLRQGANVIAVLLQTLDVATFQYVPSDNPGFAARLHGGEADGEWSVASDASWVCGLHSALMELTPRISIQQAFAEHFDACLEPVGWKLPSDENGDETLIREAGSQWRHAVESDELPAVRPRDIPHLTGEEMYPISLAEASIVRLPLPAWSVDLRSLLLSGAEARDANLHFAHGMLATTLNVARFVSVRFHFQDRTSGLNTRMAVNGQVLQPVDDSGSHWSGLFHYDVRLQPGENLLLFWFDGLAHEFTFQAAPEIVGQFDSAEELDNTARSELIPRLPDIPDSGFAFYRIEGHADVREAIFEALTAAADWTQWQKAADGRWLNIPSAAMHADNVFLRLRHSAAVDIGGSSDRHYGELASSGHNCCTRNGDCTVIAAPPAGEAVRLVLEFEKMTSGLIEFEIYGRHGAIVDFYGFEAYSGEEPVHMDSMHNSMRYRCREGWQTYRSLTHRSFRYLVVQLSGFQEYIKLKYVRCLLRTYPAPAIGRFRCDDERLNRIFEMSRWTARLCSDDVFVDCPTYEQAFWVGDAYVMSLATSSLFGAERLIERCLLLAAESLNRSPVVESQVPSGWENVLSTWSLLWALACANHARRGGYGEFAERIYPSLRQQALYYREHLTDESTGLLRSPYWNLLDWAAIDAPSSAIVTHVNAWYAESCRQTGQMAARLGRENDAEIFLGIADAICEKINAHLWDESKQAFADCLHDNGELSATASEQTQIVCYLNDVALPQRRSALLPYFRGEVTDTVRSATPFMRFFKLQALQKAGLIAPLLNEVRTTWGYMADAGSTTCWEDLPGRWAPGYPTRSYCHGWSVAPAYFLPHGIVGIGELDSSSHSLEISPKLGDLRWADCQVMTVKGAVAVRIEVSEHSFRAKVRLPEGITGWLRLPMEAHRVGSIAIDGQTAIGAYVRNGCWMIPLQGGRATRVCADS